ncbi:hypothetical protein, partial [Enterobacter hormaechei]|uniref:hypothetical protein n=1 Tax=Enterobacter hormaechei TaxID=158836 RepID=UPI0028759D25
SDGNGSHASTLKSPSYTKSVSWQHYLKNTLIMGERNLNMHHFYIWGFWIDSECKKAKVSTYRAHQNASQYHLMIDLIGRDL